MQNIRALSKPRLVIPMRFTVEKTLNRQWTYNAYIYIYPPTPAGCWESAPEKTVHRQTDRQTGPTQAQADRSKLTQAHRDRQIEKDRQKQTDTHRQTDTDRWTQTDRFT